MNEKKTGKKLKNICAIIRICRTLLAYFALLCGIVQMGILFELYYKECIPDITTNLTEIKEETDKIEQINIIEENEKRKMYIVITGVLLLLLIMYCNCPEPTIIETKPINPNFINDLLKGNAFMKTLKQMPRFPAYPED